MLVLLYVVKGLEWDVVFLVGLVDGMLFILYVLVYGFNSEFVEEECWLFYVGIIWV